MDEIDHSNTLFTYIHVKLSICVSFAKNIIFTKKSYIIYVSTSGNPLIGFIDKKGCWSIMKKCNIDNKLIDIIKHLYDNASSAILRKGAIGEWFPTKTGV